MKSLKALSLVFCIIFLWFGNYSLPAYADNNVNSCDNLHEPTNEKHWVYDELADFKQKIVQVVGRDSKYNGINEDEKNIIRNEVFNEDYLDQPLKVKYWAVLLKAVLKLPDENNKSLLNMYVYDLATEDEIAREDAVGGMVKLLSFKPYLKGFNTAEQLEPAKALKDLQALSDRQDILVRIAYCEGLVDSKATEFFRPKERLTVAEAISMLYKVVTKYSITYDTSGENDTQKSDVSANKITQGNWVDTELQNYRDRLQRKFVKLKTAESILLDGRVGNDESVLYEAVTVKKWSEVLKHVLEIKDDKVVHSYTYGLVKGETIPRDVAVAGMVKLLHYTGQVNGRDASEQERLEASAAFIDYTDAFDTSKLAIAYHEGLVKGYPDRTFRPKQALANAEALILMLNIIDDQY